MLKQYQQAVDQYSWYAIAIVATCWLALVVVPAFQPIGVYSLLHIFPYIGVGFLIIGILFRKLNLCLFGLLTSGAFYITLFLGYLLLGK